MKHIQLVILLLLFPCVATYSQKIDESFYNFLVKFSFDENFQKERIQFPLEKTFLSEDSARPITKNIDRGEWKHIYLLRPHQSYFTDIRHHFGEPEKDSTERVLVYIGIENGIDIKYYFKKLDGQWYLIKITDFST